MTLKELAPRNDERGMLVGCTGSGKTTLAKAILPLYQHVLAIDPKGTLGAGSGKDRVKGLAGYELVRNPAQLQQAAKRSPRIQYRPDPPYQGIEDYDRVYQWAFDRGHTFVYTDEVYLVMEGNRVPDALRACITSGRERGVGMLHATQRPCGVDRRILTESERFYCFKLRTDDDRKRMAEMMGEEVRRNPVTGHQFWLQTPTVDLKRCELRLG